MKKNAKALQQLRAGFALFLTDKALLHLLLLVTATGFLAFGVYLVGMPLYWPGRLIRVGRGSTRLLQVTFTMGIVVANFVVSRQKHAFKRPGRLMIISFLGSWWPACRGRPDAQLLDTVSGDLCLGRFLGNVDDSGTHYFAQSGASLSPLASRISLSAVSICRRTSGCLGLWLCHRAGGIGADLYGYCRPDAASLGDCDYVAIVGAKGC